MNVSMQPQHSCGTLEGCIKIFGCTVQEFYITLYPLDHYPLLQRACVHTKRFDASQIKLRPRRLQRNLLYFLSSHSRVDMALQSGPTIHFCFPYISKSNGWQV